MENTNTESHQFLHSYCIRPDVRFETQGTDEQVILVLRAHPITQVPWIFYSFIFILVLIIVDFFIPLFLTLNQIIFFNIFGIILIGSYIFLKFLSWFFNVGIVTNQRVIDINFSYVIYKEVTEARLDRIQDTTSKSGGFFESFFNYGDLLIQTAGTEENIVFNSIPDPADTVRMIEDLTGK